MSGKNDLPQEVHLNRSGRWQPIAASALVFGIAIAPAFGQPTFSIDYQSGPLGVGLGPTRGTPDALTGVPISEGDILITAPSMAPMPGPFPFPLGGPPANVGILTFPGGPSPGPDLGLPAYAGPPFLIAVPAKVEVDALSYGKDMILDPGIAPHEAVFAFSVDEHAVGLPFALTVGGGALADVSTEGAFGSLDGANDVFVVAFPPGSMPPFPFPPPPPAVPSPTGNVMLFDGDGVAPPFAAFCPIPIPLPPVCPFFFGLGLLEGPVSPFMVPDVGDNLDALDADTPPALATFPIYFSLVSAFPDPIEALFAPPNTGSAVAQGLGFVGGDVLVTAASGGPPAIYATATALGLDVNGPDTDDLDALVLRENGIAGYQQSALDHDWVPAGGSDMLLFSVRRGSAVIGALDSRFGFPIEEGDVLTPPPAGSPAGTPPGIWTAAEALGLVTLRAIPLPGIDDDGDGITDNEIPVPVFPGPPAIADELDGLDLFLDCNASLIPDTLDLAYGIEADCNGDGIPDSCNIVSGVSLDCNNNGIPDSCDIASGFSLDCDGNGIPDTCTTEADCDCDGDVDGVDFSVFASCFNKAGNPPRTFGCPPAWALAFDQDGDGDVDGVDFSVFASCYNKAGNPPRSPCNMP